MLLLFRFFSREKVESAALWLSLPTRTLVHSPPNRDFFFFQGPML
jgi:hypothetical protein